MADNPGKVVTRFQFSSLFNKARYLSTQLHTIVSGFRRVGVDSNAIKPYDNKTPPETPTVTLTEAMPAVTQHTEDLSALQDLSGESTYFGSEWLRNTITYFIQRGSKLNYFKKGTVR